MTNQTAAQTLKPDRRAEWLLALATSRGTHLYQRGVRRIANVVRRRWSASREPFIRFCFAGRPLILPLSHDLPLIMISHPLYSSNLPRLVSLAARRKPDLVFIDIGANIGDSVALVAGSVAVPILAIEGDETFLPLLHYNVAQFEQIEVAETYVRFAGAEQSGLTPVRSGGTAHLSFSHEAPDSSFTMTRLSDVLRDHSRFAAPGFLKVDTDGFDSRIIADCLDVLARSHPVLFFEFDPQLMHASGDVESVAVFNHLDDLGYDHVIAYQNTGELLGARSVSDTEGWRDTARAFQAGPAGHYLDLAVYHRDDSDLAIQSLLSERRFLNEWLARIK